MRRYAVNLLRVARMNGLDLLCELKKKKKECRRLLCKIREGAYICWIVRRLCNPVVLWVLGSYPRMSSFHIKLANLLVIYLNGALKSTELFSGMALPNDMFI